MNETNKNQTKSNMISNYGGEKYNKTKEQNASMSITPNSSNEYQTATYNATRGGQQ